MRLAKNYCGGFLRRKKFPQILTYLRYAPVFGSLFTCRNPYSLRFWSASNSSVNLMGALVLLLFVSCGPTPREPRAIRPESDVCAECRMTVLPEGHAAESVDSEGTVLVFDDPGCLALYVHDHPDRFRDASFFVQDVQTRDWVKWDEAVFVRADDVPAPMNYGWHGFSTPARARAFVAAHLGARLASGKALDTLADDLKDRRWRP